jgi:RNA polymerase sigma-70 factor (ECF subfamily)
MSNNSCELVEQAFLPAAGFQPEPGSFELVKAFANGIYCIAKHITQNDDAAENVLIETFLEFCSDPNECQDHENIRLRLVTIAVRQAFANLHKRAEGRLLPDWIADSHENADSHEAAIPREFLFGGDNDQPCDFPNRTTGVLERGLRSLDLMCRTVFVLRDIEDIEVEQIAMILNRSVPAVDVCLLRARFQLREMLTRQIGQWQ